MENFKEYFIIKQRTIRRQSSNFLKWFLISVSVGLFIGVIGTLFRYLIDMANDIQKNNWWLIFLLPIGGIVIVFLYKLCRDSDSGTNTIIRAVRSEDKPSYFTPILIFVSTIITHLFGGSAGREGAALQIGGGIGSTIGSIFKMNKNDMKIITMCGMSAGFSAVFGTPIAASIFAMEVTSVGIMYYAALVPCVISAFVAKEITILLGASSTVYDMVIFPNVNFISFGQTALMGVLCAVLSIIFCESLKLTSKYYAKLINNKYLRIFIGGLLIIALTFLVGSRDYNGAGGAIIINALSGNARPEAFALKLIFTVLTLGAGYKGGEIIPTFFIGSTFGCLIGEMIGLPASFGASIGMMALFCGVTNCPIASIMISIELFGVNGLWLFAVAIAISYRLSGYYSLYAGQKIAQSKKRIEFIDKKTH